MRRGLGAMVLAAVAARAVLGPAMPGGPETMPRPDGTCRRIAALPFTISQPGSYCLVGNTTAVPVSTAIIINSNDVTVDLNGFRLVAGPDPGAGIVADGRRGITVRNGTLQGFRIGVQITNGRGTLIEHLRLESA